MTSQTLLQSTMTEKNKISFANKYKQSIPIKLRSNLEKRNLGNLWRPWRQKLLTGISYDDYEPVF